MTTFSSIVRGRRTTVLGVMVLASLLAVLGSPVAASAGRAPQQERTGKWQQAMEQLHVPGKGCFTASYPTIQWQKAPCQAAPDHPYPPKRGHRPQVVGNGNDFSAEVSGLMSGATGSFDSVSSNVSETGIQNGSGPPVANTFSLQLNAKPFTTTLCSGSADPSGCQGWQQFIYSTTSNEVFIQYWLLNYNATCPSGWATFSFPNSTAVFCFTNSSASALSGPALTVAGLGSVTLTGTGTTGGSDAVVMTTGSGQATATSADSTLNLAKAWTGVEFAIVGDCCGTQANFSAGTTLKVRTTTHNGGKLAPSCVVEGFTGETNNLNLAGTPAIATQQSPTIVSEQTFSPGAAASCATAAGIGDTHLTTFRNLLYDFQASGDFELATTGSHFIVQARQVSGAPTWPDAAVNQAVATRIGTSDVAVCLAPTRLEINRRTVNLTNGVQRNLPDGGDVSRYGNVYLIRGKSGDSVRAQVNAGNPSWINVSVGLGRWPATGRGLLVNAGNNVNAIESRGGTVLTAPFAFNEFYHLYGDSWRVPSRQSLLSACGGKVASGDPRKLFYASDLPPAIYRTAHAVCVHAGVKAPPLLDACTVDVAVLRKKTAASAYLGVPADVTWGKIILPPFGPPATRY